MKVENVLDAIGAINDEAVQDARAYKQIRYRNAIRWGAMAACLCLIISGVFLFKQTTENNNVGNGEGIAMLFTEAKVIEVLSPRSVLVEVTEENIYNANTDKNLFHTGDIVQAEFNEDIVLHFDVGDIVKIGRGNTTAVDYSQKPYIVQCNSIQIKAKEDYRNIWVGATDNMGAEEAGLLFVENVYGEYLVNLPEDNSYRIEDYKLLDYTLLETSENSVSGEFTFAVKTDNEVYNAGEYTLNGSSEYDGWLILRKSFTLEHRNNPYWKCIKLEDVVMPDGGYTEIE